MSPSNPLNPFAGDVPLPEDPREIEAALRAGRVSWRLVPYYRWRYGERGAAFTRSDSAWLVTLSRHSEPDRKEQIDWLGSVLSNRGMPRWLLEIHLDTLYRELARAVPENEPVYEKLLAASFRLRETRVARIPEVSFETLSRNFASDLGTPESYWMLGTGRLLVAAVADEKDGIAHAVSGLESWLVDRVRSSEIPVVRIPTTLRETLAAVTPERWQKAVRDTVERARSA